MRRHTYRHRRFSEWDCLRFPCDDVITIEEQDAWMLSWDAKASAKTLEIVIDESAGIRPPESDGGRYADLDYGGLPLC
jgi:hypothetical protein